MSNEEEKDYTVVKEFFIAGVQHHNMSTVLDLMEVDNHLLLIPEPTNRFDSNAVRIEYATFENAAMCGYVPMKFSAEISGLLEIEEKLECVIVQLDKTAKPWEQCKVEIRKVENGSEKN